MTTPPSQPPPWPPPQPPHWPPVKKSRTSGARYLGPSGSPVARPVAKKPITVTDVTVRGDVAQAKFTRSDPPLEGALYFLNEDGAWKLCDSVSQQFDDAPG